VVLPLTSKNTIWSIQLFNASASSIASSLVSMTVSLPSRMVSWNCCRLTSKAGAVNSLTKLFYELTGFVDVAPDAGDYHTALTG
jgi:hypothetical protein